MLELYHWEPNAFFLKPLIVLHEKELDFTGHYVDVLGFDRPEIAGFGGDTVVQYNPECEGPILFHRGTVMTESFFIGLYLDEAFPGRPLRAADAKSHWRVLQWARFVNEVLAPSVCTLGCHKYLVPELRRRERAPLEQAIAALPVLERRDSWMAALNGSYGDDLLADSRRKIGLAVTKIEDALAAEDWLAGPDYSLADIDAFALLRAAGNLVPDLLNENTAPHISAWLARIAARPAVRAALAASRTGAPQVAFVPGPEHSRWG